jgi:hypothetical protein
VSDNKDPLAGLAGSLGLERPANYEGLPCYKGACCPDAPCCPDGACCAQAKGNVAKAACCARPAKKAKCCGGCQ